MKRPERHPPLRPFLLPLAALGLLLIPHVRGAHAQVVDLWALLGGMMAPETALPGQVSLTPVPLRGWDGRGAPGARGTAGSPIADPLGWISFEPPLVDIRRGSTTAYRSSRSGRLRSLVRSEWREVNAATPINARGWYLYWGGSGRRAETRLPLPGGKGGLSRNPGDRHYWAGLRAAGSGWRVLAVGGRHDAPASPFEGSLAVAWFPRGPWRLSVWYRRTSASDRFNIFYKDAAVLVEGRASGSGYGMRLDGAVGAWRLSLRAADTKRSGTGPDPGDHRLRPRPRFRLGEAALVLPGGRWSLAVGAATGTHRFEFEYLETRYGQFLVRDDRLWIRAGWQPAPERRRWRLWSGYTRTGLDGEGVLKLWPFTSTIVDLLGPQRLALADGRLDLLSAGLRLEVLESGGLQLGSGLDLHYAWVDGDLLSWEPQVLGFGRKNILRDRLQVRSAQLLDVGGEVRLRLAGNLSARMGFTQIVPLAVQERERPAAPLPGRPAGPPVKVERGGLRWWFGVIVRSPH